ncbi:MAG: choice-of-anchor D domain-containing protein [Gammaproteobacteria bacterium]
MIMCALARTKEKNNNQHVDQGYGGDWVKTGTWLRGATALLILAAMTPSFATIVAVNTTSAANGITDLFSATFDGSLSPCNVNSPSYCTFFNGWPGSANRQIVITPSPTTFINTVPLGITPTPSSGSYLNLTLNGPRTQLTIAGGVLAFPAISLTIQGNTSNATVVNANGAGVVFDVAPQTAAVNAQGQAEFFVNLAPAIAVDFSAFSTVAFPPNGSCAGNLCALIPVLTLDMVKYRLVVDYDPSFTYFTASFIGQTGNNSILSINMDSVAPEIVVTDSRAPADDLQVPFGSVTELTTATQTVTVSNTGGANLLLGAIGLANPLAPPFALGNDNCTGATVLPAAACTFNVTFTPGSVGAFSDSLDIPSNDADEPSVTVAVSGTGSAAPEPNITVTDSVAPINDGLVPFGSTGVGTQLDQTVTVSNNGNADLVLGSIAVANPLLAPYSITSNNCSGQTVAPAASCTIGLRFEPTSAGATNDSFDIPSNDATDPTVTVSVSGTGSNAATPNIVVTDNTLPADDRIVPFGNVTLGTTRDRTITVTNGGGTDLILGTVAGSNPLAAPFSTVSNNCSGQTLAPAASCEVVIRYTPVDTIASADSVDIPSNDPDEPTVTVAMSGTGINAGEGGTGTPTPSGASSGFGAIDPATLLLLGAAGVFSWRRRRSNP